MSRFRSFPSHPDVPPESGVIKEGPLWLKISETFSEGLWFTVPMLKRFSHDTHLLREEENFPTNTFTFGIAVSSSPRHYRNQAGIGHLNQTSVDSSAIPENKNWSRSMTNKNVWEIIKASKKCCFRVVWKNLCIIFRKCIDLIAFRGKSWKSKNIMKSHLFSLHHELVSLHILIIIFKYSFKIKTFYSYILTNIKLFWHSTT